MKRWLSADERKYVWSLAALSFVVRLLPAFRNDGAIATAPFWDDAYYLFSCARQLALGHGISADGIHVTNGIQPLIVLLEAPIFAIVQGDRWLGVRLSFVLFAFLGAISIVLAARIVARLAKQDRQQSRMLKKPVIVSAVMWTISWPLLYEMMNGMETSLYTCCILLVIDRYLTIELLDSSMKQYLLLGLLMGIAVLARIDATIIAMTVAFVQLIRYRVRVLTRALMFGVTALLVSAPWWYYNLHSFGSLMPISGQVESGAGVELGVNLAVAVTRLSNILIVFFLMPFGKDAMHWWPVWIGAIWLPFAYLAYRMKLLDRLRERMHLHALIPFAIAAAALGCYYVSWFHAPYFLDRYFQPIRIVWFIIAAYILAIAGERLQGHISRCLPIAVVIAGAIFALVMYVRLFVSHEIFDLYRTALWANAHPHARVGMAQSGVAGFTAENVINLDGKVNLAAARAITSGTFGKYLGKNNLDYLADWKPIAAFLVDSAKPYAHYRLIDSIDLVRIYQRMPDSIAR